MSPASISISEKETVNSSNNDNTGHAYVFTAEGSSGVKEHDMVVNDKPILSQPLQKMSSYQNVMRQRWINSNLSLPAVDKHDIGQEVPLVNGDNIMPMDKCRQA